MRVFIHLGFFFGQPDRVFESDRVYKILSDRVLFTTQSDSNLKFFKSGRVELGRVGYFAHPTIVLSDATTIEIPMVC